MQWLVVFGGLVLSAGVFITPLYAAPDDPQLQEESSKNIASLEDSQQRFAKLQKDSHALEAELQKIRKRLIRVAQGLREKEIRLLTLEEEQQGLEVETAAIRQNLTQHKTEIATLLKSLLRLSRTPPEAVIAMPGELRHTLQASSLLSHLSQQIKRRTQRLNRDLATLEQNAQRLKRTHHDVTIEKARMEQSQRALSIQLSKRKKIYLQLNRQQENEEQKIAELTKESKNLQQLLANIAAERAARQQQHARLKAIPMAKPVHKAKVAQWKVPNKSDPQDTVKRTVTVITPKEQSFAKAKGKLRLPVVGKITKHFGEKLRKNQTHRGLTVMANGQAQVVAPFGGEVVFTGPFRDYGQMVILKYDQGYHLLLAGLSDAQCVTGQRVSAGEPMGRLGADAPNHKASLYLELRHHGKPVNPKGWFG